MSHDNGKQWDKMWDRGNPNLSTLPDTGERQKFESGAVREPSSGKGRFDLLPPYPILRLAQHYENGAKKYADRNWEKGLPLSRYLDSALRHLFQFMDDERSEDHLAAAMWNIAGYIWTENQILKGELSTDLVDVPWSSSTNGGFYTTPEQDAEWEKK